MKRPKASQRRPNADLEPVDWQEAHSPTEAVEVRTGLRGRTKVRCRQRKADAALFAAMTPAQEHAAMAVAALYQQAVSPVGARISAYEPTVGQGSGTADAAMLRSVAAAQDLRDWAKAVRRDGLSLPAVYEVLGEGMSCAAVDKARRQQKGWAMSNLLASLDLWGETGRI